MFSFGDSLSSGLGNFGASIPATNYYSPSMPAAPQPAAVPVTGPSEAASTGAIPKISDRPAGFPAANTTASGLPAGATIGGVAPNAAGDVPSGTSAGGGLNYGALLAGTAKGIGHNIGTYAMAGAQNTIVPQAPSGYKPVLANIAFTDPAMSYQKPVLMG